MNITKYKRNICNLFFENQPNEIWSHLSLEKVSKGRFLKLVRDAPKLQKRRKRKGEKETAKRKKAMATLVVFIIATLEIVFGGEN